MHRICDGNSDCSGADDEHNCTIRSSYGMYSKGFEIMKYFSNCRDFFPNNIIPSSIIWLAAKYISEVSTGPVSSQLKADFGIINDDVLVSSIRDASLYNAKIESTDPLRTNQWNEKLFQQQGNLRQASSDFFYQNTSRVKVLYDSDITMTLNGIKQQYNFKNFDGNNVVVEGICVPTSDSADIVNGRVYRIKTDKNLYLYIIQSQYNIDATISTLRASTLNSIKEKLRKSGPVCLPMFSVLSSADYSPILYKVKFLPPHNFILHSCYPSLIVVGI